MKINVYLIERIKLDFPDPWWPVMNTRSLLTWLDPNFRTSFIKLRTLTEVSNVPSFSEGNSLSRRSRTPGIVLNANLRAMLETRSGPDNAFFSDSPSKEVLPIISASICWSSSFRVSPKVSQFWVIFLFFDGKIKDNLSLYSSTSRGLNRQKIILSTFWKNVEKV